MRSNQSIKRSLNSHSQSLCFFYCNKIYFYLIHIKLPTLNCNSFLISNIKLTTWDSREWHKKRRAHSYINFYVCAWQSFITNWIKITGCWSFLQGRELRRIIKMYHYRVCDVNLKEVVFLWHLRLQLTERGERTLLNHYTKTRLHTAIIKSETTA